MAQTKCADFPLRIEIEPTNACNAHCSFCPRRFMPGEIGYMKPKLYYNLIDEIERYPARTLVLFRRGESLLHPEFKALLQYTKGKFKEVQLATNASVMDKEMANLIAECVDFISFSLELPARYEEYRGFSYENVVKNIEYFISINTHAVTQASMVKTPDLTQDAITYFSEMWMPKVNRVRIYEQHSTDGHFGSLSAARPHRVTCCKPFSEMLIFWNGEVGRCNHDWGGYSMGSVTQGSIASVWQNLAYQRLRKEQAEVCITDPACKHCDSWYESDGACTIGNVYEQI